MGTVHRAVAPVAGVVVLLAIVFVVTALVGTMVLHVGGDSAPTVRPEYDGTISADRPGDDDQVVVLGHGGGATLELA